MTDQNDKKPLSHQDRHDAFMRAVHSTSDAKARWEQHAKTGLSDAKLQEALRNELGIFGGSTGPDMLGITYQGSGLKIWASWDGVNHCLDEPVLQGSQTIDYARQVFGIPNPDVAQLSLF